MSTVELALYLRDAADRKAWPDMLAAARAASTPAEFAEAARLAIAMTENEIRIARAMMEHRPPALTLH